MKYFHVTGKRADSGTPIEWYVCAPDLELLKQTLFQSDITPSSIDEITDLKLIYDRDESLELISLENRMDVPSDHAESLRPPPVAENTAPQDPWEEFEEISKATKRQMPTAGKDWMKETLFQHQKTGWRMLLSGLMLLMFVGMNWFTSYLFLFLVLMSEPEIDSPMFSLAKIATFIQAGSYFLLAFCFVWITLGAIFYFSGLIKRD